MVNSVTPRIAHGVESATAAIRARGQVVAVEAGGRQQPAGVVEHRYDTPASRPAPVPTILLSSGLTTYQSPESGRMIVRIFDRRTGDVLMEFPPEKAVVAPPNPGVTQRAKPTTKITV